MTMTKAERPKEQQALLEADKPEEKLLDEVLDRTAGRIDALAGRYVSALEESYGHLSRALLRAKAIETLRKAIRPLMQHIVPLMNTPLGFLTDRDPKRSKNQVTAYPLEVVEDCIVEALLRGLRLDGNEWNIISGTCYTTKNGYARLVSELPGLTDCQVSIGVPQMKEGGALVRVRAAWKLHGRPMELIDEKGEPGRTLAIRVNAGMGADAIAGKAERKALAAVFKAVTGSAHSDADVEDEAKVEAPDLTRSQSLAARLLAAAEKAPEQEVDPVDAEERKAIESEAK